MEALNEKYDTLIMQFAEETNNSNENWNHLFSKLRQYDVYIADWKNEDLDIFIKSLQTISVNTINKYLQIVRKFYNWACKKEGVKPRRLFLSYDLKYYIDLQKFMSITISYYQYQMLRRSLTENVEKDGYKEFNFRDKLIVELAWAGLSNEEIKLLTTKQIEYTKDIAILHVEGRNISIYDEEVIADLKSTEQQNIYYLRPTLYKKEQWRDLKQSDYVIKPIETRNSKTMCVANPTQLLQRSFQRSEITIDGIDIEHLNLENIKRSRILHMLIYEGASIETIQYLCGKAVASDMYWLVELAEKIKKNVQ
jgi:site-specific recombinase XerD